MAATKLVTLGSGMRARRGAAMRQTGFTMIEVLVSLLIIVLGLLGLAGLQTRLQQAEFESYQRAQALVLLYDIVDRIHMHNIAATCFRFTTDTTTGSPYIGTGATAPTGCAATGGADADTALSELDAQLDGAAETKGGASVGAIVGARACVSYDAGTELTGSPGTGIYTVAVAWQGTVDVDITGVSKVACANDQFSSEASRRVVSTTFRLARLN